MSKTRSRLYWSARKLGNLEAMSKGPTAYGKRTVRRHVYRKSAGLTAKLLRRLGL